MTNDEIMQIRWTTFEPPKLRPTIPPIRSSITNIGLLTLNYTAFRSMGQPESVHVMFDSGNGLIGLKPVRPNTPNAKHLKQRKDRRLSFWIRVRDFCNYYGIDYRKGIRFQRIEPQDDGTLVLYLDPSTKYFRRTDG
jgi:hypothetical protein